MTPTLTSYTIPIENINPESIKIADTLCPITMSTDNDVDGDGLADLLMHFSRRDLIDALSLDAYDVGEVVDITINATLFDDDWPIEATDSIVIVGKNE